MVVNEISPELALRQLHREFAVVMERALRAERLVSHLVFVHGPLELPVDTDWFPPDLSFKQVRQHDKMVLKISKKRGV